MKQNNGTLYSNMATVLKNNNKYDELLLQDIIKALYSETFAELVLELERREFPGKSSICTRLATSGIFKQVINLYLIWNIKNSQASLQLGMSGIFPVGHQLCMSGIPRYVVLVLERREIQPNHQLELDLGTS